MSTKDRIKEFLEKKDFDGVVEFARRDRNVTKYLTSLLYSEDNLLHWRAADALGKLTVHQDVLSENKARIIIGRLFTNLEDQSGGNGWGSMEAIGAMIAAQPYRLSSFVPKMISKISDARLWVGLLWSIRQIGEKQPDLFKDYIFHVVGLLRNPRRATRGHAAWALGAIGDADVRVLEGLILDVRETLGGLLNDKNLIPIYIDGDIHERVIGDIAKEALASLRARE